ncbi:MAG: hypothetical protein SFU98_02405 [Leptospiraceae bacterium]|nr:hypothetical protein [Leptospiraceae bacterium]
MLLTSKKLFLNLLILLLFVLNCYTSENKPKTEEKPIEIKPTETVQDKRDDSVKKNYEEQISCNANDCVVLNYDDYSELDDKISEELSKNSGKILIKMRNYTLKLESEELEGVTPYLRELAKREGRISYEPLYIGVRGTESLGFGFVKDSSLVGYTIFQRVRNLIKYRKTENYNAKVIFHPKYRTVTMIYFLHKSYGDVCSTIYSDCKEIEYSDDDLFDETLSRALKENDSKPVRVNFNNTKTKLFEAKLDLENLKSLKQSARLYKWLVLTEKTENKPISRERIIGIELAITVLDYSITLYDKLKEYEMYKPVFKLKAEVSHTGKERGGTIHSVIFNK